MVVPIRAAQGNLLFPPPAPAACDSPGVSSPQPWLRLGRMAGEGGGVVMVVVVVVLLLLLVVESGRKIGVVVAGKAQQTYLVVV